MHGLKFFSMYIFSDKYKLRALLTFKCFIALLFSLTVFSHTAFHCLLIFNFSPQVVFFNFFGRTSKYISICVHMFCICIFQFSLPRHVWSCCTCSLCNKALFSLKVQHRDHSETSTSDKRSSRRCWSIHHHRDTLILFNRPHMVMQLSWLHDALILLFVYLHKQLNSWVTKYSCSLKPNQSYLLDLKNKTPSTKSYFHANSTINTCLLQKYPASNW